MDSSVTVWLLIYFMLESPCLLTYNGLKHKINAKEQFNVFLSLRRVRKIETGFFH